MTRSGGDGGGGARGEGQRGEKGALTTPLRAWYHIGVCADGKQNKSDLSSCRYKGHHKSALKQMCCFCRMARIIAPCLSRHAAEGQGPHGGEEKGGARAVQESGGSFLSVGRPLSLSWRPTMSPWQRARREGGRPLLLFSCSTALHGRRRADVPDRSVCFRRNEGQTARARRGGRPNWSALQKRPCEVCSRKGGREGSPSPARRPPSRPPAASTPRLRLLRGFRREAVKVRPPPPPSPS